MYPSVLCRLLTFIILLGMSALSVLAQTPVKISPGKSWVETATVPSPVIGQKRLALIIGNTHYGADNDLKNPENDAKAIAKTLASLGFASTVILDGTLGQMSDAVHDFANKIRAAGKSSVALLYYSGHGVQVNGENYLIPVGFKMPTHDRDMLRYALSAQTTLEEMQQANAQVNIAILDACRNNPFVKDRALGGKGLAKLEAQGVLVAYATAAGDTASDNIGGQNGLYTASLLPFLSQPGLSLTSVFSRTRKAVYEASGKKQFPYVYDGLIDSDEFCLMPTTVAPVPPPAADNSKVNPKDSAEMVYIPAGEFLMGDEDRKENPRRIIRLPAYYIYRNVVTVDMYEKFCRETGHAMPPAPPFNQAWNKKRNPIVNVTIEDAQAYCDWAGVTLPTEEQWEKAARGTDGRQYPWGNEFNANKLWGSKVRYGDAGGTRRIGDYPSGASPYGCLDMAGNVWQWCIDPNAPRNGIYYLRGGSYWDYKPDEFRASYRLRNNLKNPNFGFRCVSRSESAN